MFWLIGETVSNSEVWSVVGDALDSFLFSEYKPPKVRSFVILEEKKTNSRCFTTFWFDYFCFIEVTN